jgi:hypothetical protein
MIPGVIMMGHSDRVLVVGDVQNDFCLEGMPGY